MFNNTTQPNRLEYNEHSLSAQELLDSTELTLHQKGVLIESLDTVPESINSNTVSENSLIRKLQNNPYYSREGDEVIIKLNKYGGTIPVAFYDMPNNDGIAAIQEFDPNTPENKEVISNAQYTIDDAIGKGYINQDPTDKNFVEFCIYAANKAINKKRPEQDDNANNKVVDNAVQNTGGIVHQAQIERSGAQVCKDFAPVFAIILENNNAGNVHLVSSKSEEHMFTLVDIPGHGVQRVDAKKDPEIVRENTIIDLYEEFGSKTSQN